MTLSLSLSIFLSLSVETGREKRVRAIMRGRARCEDRWSDTTKRPRSAPRDERVATERLTAATVRSNGSREVREAAERRYRVFAAVPAPTRGSRGERRWTRDARRAAATGRAARGCDREREIETRAKRERPRRLVGATGTATGETKNHRVERLTSDEEGRRRRRERNGDAVRRRPRRDREENGCGWRKQRSSRVLAFPSLRRRIGQSGGSPSDRTRRQAPPPETASYRLSFFLPRASGLSLLSPRRREILPRQIGEEAHRRRRRSASRNSDPPMTTRGGHAAPMPLVVVVAIAIAASAATAAAATAAAAVVDAVARVPVPVRVRARSRGPTVSFSLPAFSFFPPIANPLLSSSSRRVASSMSIATWTFASMACAATDPRFSHTSHSLCFVFSRGNAHDKGSRSRAAAIARSAPTSSET